MIVTSSEKIYFNTAKKQVNRPFNTNYDINDSLAKSMFSGDHISFSGKVIKQKNSVIIRNLLAPKEEVISVAANDDIKLSPYKISRMLSDNKRMEVVVYDQSTSKVVAVAKSSLSGFMPEVDLQLGNFQPTFILKDKKVNTQLLLSGDSVIKARDFEIVTGNNVTQHSGGVAFTGHSSKLFVHDAYRAKETRRAVQEYFSEELYKNTDRGEFAGNFNNQYSIYAMVGGYGSRLTPLLELNKSNKPAMFLPGQKYRLLHVSVLDMAMRAGLIDPERIKQALESRKTKQIIVCDDIIKNPDSDSDLVYLTGPADTYLNTGGALVTALKKGIIPDDKPLIIMTGDIFSNIDLSKAIREFEATNSGVLRIGITVPPDKAKQYGCLEVVEDGKSVFRLVSPRPRGDLSGAEMKKGKHKGKYLVASNYSIVHPKLLKLLKDIEEPGKPFAFDNFQKIVLRLLNAKETFAPNSTDKRLFDLLLRLDFIDENGNPKDILDEKARPLKVNISVAKTSHCVEPFWNDMGTFMAFIDELRRVHNSSNSTYRTLPPVLQKSIYELVEKDSGVVYMSEKAKKDTGYLMEKYGISEMNGHIIAMDKREQHK